jgi:hypothetical protein
MKPHLYKPFVAEEFIAKAKAIHGNKFDYSKIKDGAYSSYLKVEIGCPVHGYFEQEAGYHLLNGHGCRKCGQIATNSKLRKTLDVEDFIFKSKEIFGSQYDYSNVKADCYVGGRPIVSLICKQHGPFTVNAHDHLGIHGARCKRCSKRESYGEFLVRRALENLKINFEQQKTFDACRNPSTNRKLFFDFYLPDKNVLIEFDGEYHFIPPTFGKRNHSIDDIQLKDKIKEDFANNNGLILHRIHYKNRNPKSINQFIEEKL